MNWLKRINYRATDFIFTNVHDKTLGYILLTVIITALLGTFIFGNSDINPIHISTILAVLYIIYLIFSHEKVLKKHQALMKEIKYLEDRTKSIVVGSGDALYIQNADLPVVFDTSGISKYSVQFKVKVVHECFGFVFNVSDQKNGYMIQYNENSKTIRPHFLLGVDKDISQWITPQNIANYLTEKTDVIFSKVDGYYYLRFEINNVDHDLQGLMSKLDPEKVLESFKSNSSGLTYEKDNIKKYVHLKVYDMNDVAKTKYEIIYTEPPYKIFSGNYFGFRQFGHEAAIFKNIKLIKC